MRDLLSSRSYQLSQLSTWEDLVGAGIYAVEVRSAMQIIIGYLAKQVEKRYGEDRLGSFAFELGLAARTVRDWRSVYTFWYKENGASAPFTARAELPEHASYTHMRVAARHFDDALTALPALETALDDSLSGDRWAVTLAGKAERKAYFQSRLLNDKLLDELKAAHEAGRVVYLTGWEVSND